MQNSKTKYTEQYASICQKALKYKERAEKTYALLLQEIAQASSTKDIARLEYHKATMTTLLSFVRSNAVAIEISNIKKLQHVQESDLKLMVQGAESVLQMIIHHTAALEGAIGMTKYIPEKE